VNPTLEVVRELIHRGHEVCYYSHDVMKEKIENTGAKYISCNKYGENLNLKPEDAKRIGKDVAFSINILIANALALDEDIYVEMKEWNPDCVVADNMAVWGRRLAEKLDIPFISSTSTFALNQHTARNMRRDFGEMLRMIISAKKAKRNIKKLKDIGYHLNGVFGFIHNDNAVDTIVYTSKEFQPYIETFSDKFLFVGPLLGTYEIPIRNKSNRKIYISLGTVNNSQIEFYKNCIGALKDWDGEVIMSIGLLTQLSELGEIPSNFTVQQRVNQKEVLKDIDVFITHGGMNSTSEALYYQVPLILFPQTREQSGVAYRVNELGAGVYLENDSEEAIKKAVEEVLNNESYKENARKIAESFYRCGGAEAAADKIIGSVRNK